MDWAHICGSSTSGRVENVVAELAGNGIRVNPCSDRYGDTHGGGVSTVTHKIEEAKNVGDTSPLKVGLVVRRR